MKKYMKYVRPYRSAFIIGPLMMLTEVFGEIYAAETDVDDHQ